MNIALCLVSMTCQQRHTAASEMKLHGPGFIYLSLFSSDDVCQVLLLKPVTIQSLYTLRLGNNTDLMIQLWHWQACFSYFIVAWSLTVDALFFPLTFAYNFGCYRLLHKANMMTQMTAYFQIWNKKHIKKLPGRSYLLGHNLFSMRWASGHGIYSGFNPVKPIHQ